MLIYFPEEARTVAVIAPEPGESLPQGRGRVGMLRVWRSGHLSETA